MDITQKASLYKVLSNKTHNYSKKYINRTNTTNNNRAEEQR